jgi:tripartite-type tricarboxylate transporter receptor subunit TctC
MANLNRRLFSKIANSLLMGASSMGMRTPLAQPISNKPVKVVVPYSPGGGTDVIGRSLLQNMSGLMGQAFILDNKPGAGTVIGTDYVAKSEPDGKTLLLTSSAVSINASLIKNLPYNTLRDLAPIARICEGPNVIVVRADSPFLSIGDVIRSAKEKPGALSYASSGNGSAVHLAGELFKLMSGIQIQHIPYKGAGPAYTDLLGGQVDMLIGTAGGVHKFVQTGRMRALGVTSAERSKAYPGVPTVGETLRGFVAQVWYAVYAPKGTPLDLINTLNEFTRKAVSIPAYQTTLESDGLVASVNSPVEMALFMKAEVERWQKVVQQANISID